MVLLRERVACRGIGAIEPCLPSPAKEPPSGPGWLHEIKHDGFRILARRDTAGVRLFTRNGTDFTGRFPQIIAAIGALPVRACLIDGEAIVCDENGLADFELIRRHRHGPAAVLCAFDLIELDGRDLRRAPIEQRKQTLAKATRGRIRASCSTSTSRATARSFFVTHASWAARASYQSGSARRTSPAARRTGSRSRTQMHRRSRGRRRRTGNKRVLVVPDTTHVPVTIPIKP